MWLQMTPEPWSLTQKDVVLSVVMVIILFVGMYVLFRMMLAARKTEPAYPMLEENE